MSASRIGFSAPSNIALIKYWGKGLDQTPKNASLSFSLKNSVTKTYLDYQEKIKGEPQFNFSFEGKSERSFHPKIEKLFQYAFELYPHLKGYSYKIESENTFPHSTGIASSASSMAALSLCLTTLAKNLNEPLVADHFTASASYLARLGSGSAGRSVYGGFTLWGTHEQVAGSNNKYAIDINASIHPELKKLGDTILIVSSEAKSLSSSDGHKLMNENPYAVTRFLQANLLISEMMGALKSGDMEKLGLLIEKEALGLHALMMLSQPPHILLKPNSLKLIELIQTFRRESKLPLYFTIDAGPNIHLIYPLGLKAKVEAFIQERCLPYLEKGFYIHDEIGEGPTCL